MFEFIMVIKKYISLNNIFMSYNIIISSSQLSFEIPCFISSGILHHQSRAWIMLHPMRCDHLHRRWWCIIGIRSYCIILKLAWFYFGKTIFIKFDFWLYQSSLYFCSLRWPQCIVEENCSFFLFDNEDVHKRFLHK